MGSKLSLWHRQTHARNLCLSSETRWQFDAQCRHKLRACVCLCQSDNLLPITCKLLVFVTVAKFKCTVCYRSTRVSVHIDILFYEQQWAVRLRERRILHINCRHIGSTGFRPRADHRYRQRSHRHFNQRGQQLEVERILRVTWTLYHTPLHRGLSYFETPKVIGARNVLLMCRIMITKCSCMQLLAQTHAVKKDRQRVTKYLLI